MRGEGEAGMSRPQYPKHCCQECGEEVGYIGRLLEWFFGTMHLCRWDGDSND